jgi:predicted CoA-binding protein
MTIDGLTDDRIRDILAATRAVAIVGASANPIRASFGVAGFLAAQGYAVTPVNPGLAGQTLHGTPVVATLDDAGSLDMVDIFRASNQVPQVVDDAIRLGAKTIWMQLGVFHMAAAAKATAAGITVVMDRCPSIEIGRLGITRAA